jgi:hypothetical protein
VIWRKLRCDSGSQKHEPIRHLARKPPVQPISIPSGEH